MSAATRAAWDADMARLDAALAAHVIESPGHLAERYVSAFMGDNESATVYRERLVVLIRNAVNHDRMYNRAKGAA